MKIKTFFAVSALLASSSLAAQNTTTATLNSLTSKVNALSAKVTKLESNLERVITENVNLVDQLNIKKVTTTIDNNNIQWDIVKVHADPSSNDVTITLRATNLSNENRYVCWSYKAGEAIDSNSNLDNNVYEIIQSSSTDLEPNLPINMQLVIKKVPTTCSYLAMIKLAYDSSHGVPCYKKLKFTGVHIPR